MCRTSFVTSSTTTDRPVLGVNITSRSVRGIYIIYRWKLLAALNCLCYLIRMEEPAKRTSRMEQHTTTVMAKGVQKLSNKTRKQEKIQKRRRQQSMAVLAKVLPIASHLWSPTERLLLTRRL